ncbi:MAG: right-handed parallel beta-helix repeat-containing protein [Anaerolineae bacterium]|nr:right-handed parallel beta-helix repeat-containing protein [Anaerolineae bacterium]
MEILVKTLTLEEIQHAIDQVSLYGGGRVFLPEGICLLQNAIQMRSGVRLEGVPGKTILKKLPSTSARIKGYLGYGHYEVRVHEPAKFSRGMGIYIYDEQAGGFYTTTATILDIVGDRLYIDQMLNHDYSEERGGTVVTVHPLVSFRGVRHASIAHLVLDGNLEEEPNHINGCRGGNVYMLMSHDITVEHVEVKNFNGDGISFQQCTDVRVRQSFIHHNAGHGLHPGSGSVRYWLLENKITHNQQCGIFYCLRTTHSLCAHNVIENNGSEGISLGERDTHHLIQKNKIASNGSCGIYFRPSQFPADYTEIIENEISDNCTAQGKAQITICSSPKFIQIARNSLSSKEGLLSIEGNPSELYISNNQPEIYPGARPGVHHEEVKLPVGPEVAGPDSARHLNVLLTTL